MSNSRKLYEVAMFLTLTGAWLGGAGTDGVPVSAAEASNTGTPHSREDELYPSSQAIWRTLGIPVCWENPTAGNASGRAWTQDQVEKTWESATYVDFTGWGACTSGAEGIHIQVVETPEPAHAAVLGRGLNGVTNGLVLSFAVQSGEGCLGEGPGPAVDGPRPWGERDYLTQWAQPRLKGERAISQVRVPEL
ncbi:hypothetical protein MYSTI_06825 [Myxococcus stipitatus DSM 14675]|uniref:Uncharacterized protein n=1 Tax=Myxococcus stipitatus (strain DSM 14675 / JCM 12634 / Mx s8) TaxID=1278073 RepID=L7UJA5_MYXSD|nr:hypothetical protein MYSTI_06825 [Myxococcus stipitatus DSM 14675]